MIGSACKMFVEHIYVCRRVRVVVSQDLWSGPNRKYREISTGTFFSCNSHFSPLSVFHPHSASTQLARSRSSPQNGGSGEARRPPLLGTHHPRCQECQLKEWQGHEGKGEGKAV